MNEIVKEEEGCFYTVPGVKGVEILCSTGSEDPNKEQLMTRRGYRPIRLFAQVGRLECEIRTAATNGEKTWFELRASIKRAYLSINN